VVSQTGGHIGAGLGVVELTIALLHVFDSPRDRIVWDVGHQGYPWKILTGRNAELPTLRQRGGLSGFLRRTESPHDHFGGGRAGSSSPRRSRRASRICGRRGCCSKSWASATSALSRATTSPGWWTR